MGFRGGDTNLYAYVANDPVNLTDPTGRNPVVAVLGVGAAAYLIYKWYDSLDDFQEETNRAKAVCAAKDDRLASKDHEVDDLDYWLQRQCSDAKNKAGRAGGAWAKNTPGTSATGPPPTSAEDAIISGCTDAIVDGQVGTPPQ